MQPLDMQYDEGLQYEILAFILRNPAFLMSHPNVVKPQYFTNPILMAIAGAYLGQENVIVLTPNELLHAVHQADEEYAAEHRSAIVLAVKKLVKTRYNPLYLEREVVKFARYHAVAQAWLDGIDTIREKRYEEALLSMREAMSVGENIYDGGTRLSQVDPAEIYACNSSDYFPTGYPTVDRCLSGGLGRGELGLIVGTSGRGKSLVCHDIAVSGGRHKTDAKVLIVTLELSEKRYFQRILTRISKINKRLAQTNLSKVEAMRAAYLAKSRSDISVKQLPSAGPTVADIEGLVLRETAQNRRPDLLIVDYADLLCPMTPRHNQWLELMETFTHLRGLAVRQNIPVWTPSQGKTQAYGKTTMGLQDVGGSIGKVQIADVILMLNQTADEKTIGELRLTITKSRNDESDISVKMGIDYDQMKLTDRGLA